MTDTPMTPAREQEIRETHPSGWYDGPWTHDYVEGEGGEPDCWRVVHHESGTTLATLPAWAGGIALFIADAHVAVPELLAEVDRLRARVAELEGTPIDEAAELAEGAAELEAMRADHPAPCRVPDSPDCTCPDEDSHEQKVAEYLATPYTEDAR